MPIQFRCSQCGEPIEVDDEHANQTASCPYCRHLVTVPTESTYQPTQAVVARPAEGHGTAPGGWPSDQGGPSSAPVTPVLSDRQRLAVTFGNYALVCAVLAVLAFGAAMIRAAVLMYGDGQMAIGPQPSSEQMQEMQRRLAADSWVGILMMGFFLLSLTGVALSIASLVHHRANNWRAIVAMAFCGAIVVCFCSAEVVGRLMGFGM